MRNYIKLITNILLTEMICTIKKISVLIIACLCCCIGYAQKSKRVTGEYIYVVPKNISQEEAEHIALEQAKQDAIDKAFGTLISRTNITRQETHNGESTIDVSSLGESLSKGEWVRTIGEPVIEPIRTENGEFAIKCTIKGVVREITSAKTEFKAKVLCNGKEKRFESTDFNDGDQLFLSFQTPKDGYVAVYLLGTNHDVTCLLPYASDGDGQEPVKHGVDYIFFEPKETLIDGWIRVADESSKAINLYCDEKTEINKMYIIFSPTPFTKAVDYADKNGNRSLPENDFLKWLGEHRSIDSQMAVETIDIRISK